MTRRWSNSVAHALVRAVSRLVSTPRSGVDTSSVARSDDAARTSACATVCICLVSALHAQDTSIEPVRPMKPAIVRPYLAPQAPPARLNNSGRLGDLIRAGTLYLTAQDAIALALENNIDLESARYNPLIAAWNLERSQAGGALPGVPNAAGFAGSVASGQGVAGSQAAAGVGGGGGGGAGGGGGNATISQIGPIAQTLDPSIQESSVFSHITTPEPNATQSEHIRAGGRDARL